MRCVYIGLYIGLAKISVRDIRYELKRVQKNQKFKPRFKYRLRPTKRYKTLNFISPYYSEIQYGDDK